MINSRESLANTVIFSRDQLTHFMSFFYAEDRRNSRFVPATERQILLFFSSRLIDKQCVILRNQSANSKLILFRIFQKSWKIAYQFRNLDIKKYNSEKHNTISRIATNVRQKKNQYHQTFAEKFHRKGSQKKTLISSNDREKKFPQRIIKKVIFFHKRIADEI